jgi:hypothetical protein
MRPPKYREKPELLTRPPIRCECSPGCQRMIRPMVHYVEVKQYGGAVKRVSVEHLGRFSDAEHHPAVFGPGDPSKVANLGPRGKGTPMPPADDK